MKIKVTVFNATRSMNGALAIGQEVVIIHDPTSKGAQYDPKVLAVFDEQTGKQVGVIGNKPGSTVIPGTETNEVLFDKMNGRVMKDAVGRMTVPATVVDQGNVSFKDGSNRTAYILEAKLPHAPVSGKVKDFILTVRGSVKEHKGKTTVLREIQSGKPCSVWLKADKGELVAYLAQSNGDKVTAGVVSSAQEGSLDEAVAYLEGLAKHNSAQIADAVSASGNTFNIAFSVDPQNYEDVLKGKVVMTFAELKKDIVSKGITTEGTLKSIEKYLKGNQVTEKQIHKIFQAMRLYRDEVKARIPSEPQVKYKDTTGLVKKSVVYLNLGKHLRLVGEKGVGKNVLIETMAWVYQRPLYELSLNSQFDKMDLLGTKTFETTVENGKEMTKISFDKGVFIQAMEEGGFMNLDEVNTADPSVMVELHPVADGRGRLEVPGYGLVEADCNFAMLLTMNRDYIGTSPLNEATRDRFIPIIFPTVPSIAKMLAAKVPTADPNDIQLVDAVYASIVKVIKDGQLTNDCLTNRGFIDALEAAPELGLLDALMDNVANRIEDEEYRSTVASFIDDKVG